MRGEKQVLVVEDDRYIGQSLADALGAEGYAVQVATNGQTGLMLAERNKPDLILLDLSLPELSGEEVLAELRRGHLTADIRVIVVSARASTNPLIVAEVDGWIQKPFDLDDLLQQVEYSLSGAGLSLSLASSPILRGPDLS